jgi:inosine-uridine nucleoside N-ribohydrolase
MDYPKLTNQFLLNRLELPEGKINMVLDTDTYNEIDDQFALMYALRSPERLNVQAVYAAPFHNERSEGPCDGMEKSFDEIYRVLDRMNIKPAEGFVLKGSPRYLENLETPCESEAVRDLIKRAMASEEPLYVVAIGAITNIASAILLEPRIIEKIVVVWLGGHALHWPDTKEFNLEQDVLAARVVFDCGVPMVQIPCMNVVSHLTTTLAELERYIDGKNSIGSYLTQIVREYSNDHIGWSKVIWDISAIAFLIDPTWVPTNIVHSPVLTDQVTWSVDQSRHFIKSAYHVDRDQIFKDLFKKV